MQRQDKKHKKSEKKNRLKGIKILSNESRKKHKRKEKNLKSQKCGVFQIERPKTNKEARRT